MLDSEEQLPVPRGTLAPTQDNVPATELDEVNEMLYVRNTRMAINRHLMPNGQIPNDQESLDLLMKNLKDMDSSAVARSRIKSEEKTSEAANASMIALVGQTLQAMRGGRALPPVEVIDVEAAVVDVPQLPEHLERKEFVAGEMQIGTIHEDVDQFKQRMASQYEKEGK
jgi:hypothetical protein